MSKNTLYKLVKKADWLPDPMNSGNYNASAPFTYNQTKRSNIAKGKTTDVDSRVGRTKARKAAVANGTMTPTQKAAADKKDAEHTQQVDNLSKKVAPWIAGGQAAILTALALPAAGPAVWTGVKTAAPHIAKIYNGVKKATDLATIAYGATQVPGAVGQGVQLATGRRVLPQWWKAINQINGSTFQRKVQRFFPIETADIDLLRQYKGESSYQLRNKVVPGETPQARKKRLQIANRLQRALAIAGYPQYLITENQALGRKFNPDRWFDSEGNLLNQRYTDYRILMHNGRKILQQQHRLKSPNTPYVPNDAEQWKTGVEHFYATMHERFPSSQNMRQKFADMRLYAHNHPTAAKFGVANAMAGNIATTMAGLKYPVGKIFSPAWWKTMGLTGLGAGGVQFYDKLMDSKHRSQALKTYTPTINTLKNQLQSNQTTLKTLQAKINDGNLQPEEHKKALQDYQQAKAIVQRLQYQLAAVQAQAAGNYTNNRNQTPYLTVPIPGAKGIFAPLQAGVTQHGNVASFRHQDKVDYNPMTLLYPGGRFAVDPNTGTMHFKPSTTWNAGVLSRLYDTGVPWWQRGSHAALQLNSPFIQMPAAFISAFYPNSFIGRIVNKIYSNPYIVAQEEINRNFNKQIDQQGKTR